MTKTLNICHGKQEDYDRDRIYEKFWNGNGQIGNEAIQKAKSIIIKTQRYPAKIFSVAKKMFFSIQKE